MFHVKQYAGIGSRETPKNILKLMSKISIKLESDGYTLRSGGAVGADTAFECSINDKEIFTASDATPESISMAEEFHPTWEHCGQYTQKLHGRNCMIILGNSLDNPVKFVVCWTSNGKDKGGTGLAIRLARHHGIRVFNLYDADVRDRFTEYVGDAKNKGLMLL